MGFVAWCGGEVQAGQDVGLGVIQQGGEHWQLGAQRVGDTPPLGFRGLGVFLGEGGGDEGGDHVAAVLGGMGQDIAHEVGPAALPFRSFLPVVTHLIDIRTQHGIDFGLIAPSLIAEKFHDIGVDPQIHVRLAFGHG